jgi:spermidine/putrescine-binding protein
VSLYDCGECNYIATALSLGFDPWNTTPEQDAQIKQKLIEIKPNLLNYWADFTEINQLIASGDVWVAANVWNDALQTATAEGVPVEYITPKEGRLGWVCGFGIATNSPNVDLAYAYIDAALAPVPMAYLSNNYAYGAANAKALELTDSAFVEMFSLDDTSILERTVFYRPITEAQRETFTSAWTEVKAAP